jgi:hypothetical protein
MERGPRAEGPLREEAWQAVQRSAVAPLQWEPLLGEALPEEAVQKEPPHIL